MSNSTTNTRQATIYDPQVLALVQRATVPAGPRARQATDVPSWMTSLLARVANDHGRTDLPRLSLRRSSTKPLTSGRTTFRVDDRIDRDWYKRIGVYPTEIVVTAGSSPMDTLYIFVHELCHWLRWDTYHDGPFYNLFFNTVVALRLPPTYVALREYCYKSSCLIHICEAYGWQYTPQVQQWFVRKKSEVRRGGIAYSTMTDDHDNPWHQIFQS